MKTFILAAVFLGVGFAAIASEKPHSHASGHASQPAQKYAGQDTRAIKSLSADDIAELRGGGGWGMAKAAELNGVPGPAHLLELKDKIPLSDSQVLEIRALFDGMKTRAIVQGEELIKLEGQLEDHFRLGTITHARLRSSLHAIVTARKELRYIHLATHLATPKILSADQIAKYNQLRGYTVNNH